MEIAARYGLSSRETEVFMLLAQGRSRRYISDELFIAEGTVANHTGRVYEKLGVHSKQELLSLVHPKQEGNAQTTKPVAGGPRSPENE